MTNVTNDTLRPVSCPNTMTACRPEHTCNERCGPGALEHYCPQCKMLFRAKPIQATLVERLRQCAEAWPVSRYAFAATEAADEIESLTIQRDEIQGAYDRANAENSAEIERLGAENVAFRAYLAEYGPGCRDCGVTAETSVRAPLFRCNDCTVKAEADKR